MQNVANGMGAAGPPLHWFKKCEVIMICAGQVDIFCLHRGGEDQKSVFNWEILKINCRLLARFQLERVVFRPSRPAESIPGIILRIP